MERNRVGGNSFKKNNSNYFLKKNPILIHIQEKIQIQFQKLFRKTNLNPIPIHFEKNIQIQFQILLGKNIQFQLL